MEHTKNEFEEWKERPVMTKGYPGSPHNFEVSREIETDYMTGLKRTTITMSWVGELDKDIAEKFSILNEAIIKKME